ncbi:hypothetical protein L0F63_007183, partial [Massospora cicadina]
MYRGMRRVLNSDLISLPPFFVEDPVYRLSPYSSCAERELGSYRNDRERHGLT